MKRISLSLLAFLLAATAYSSSHCPVGCPSGAPSSNYTVARAPYILSNNGTTKFADWVAYEISAATIGGSKSRSWKADPAIWSSRTLEPADYTNAHATLQTDRGHQAPLASLSAYSDWKSLNYLSNITPQKSNLNQGPWNRLEGKVRELIQNKGFSSVYVATGPLYEYHIADLPNADESHTIPSGYWKVIFTKQNNTVQTAAFIMDQNLSRHANYCHQLTTIDQVEYRSGLNLLPSMSNQGSIESRTGYLRDELGC